MKEETKTQIPKKPQSKGVRILKKILNTIINIMIVCVLIISVLIAVFALTSKDSGISTMFGYTIQPIQSDSMKGTSPDGYPGGDFEKGDLMIAKATGFDADKTYELGDIITYKTADTNGEVMLIVHRIVDVADGPNGTKTYQTQGDNRETSPIPDQMEEEEYLNASDIGSIYYTSGYEGKILKGWGKLLDFLQSQQGFFFAVLLPMIIFFIYELIRVVMNVSYYRKAKDDEEKQAAVDAAVAEALSGKSDGSLLENATDEERAQFEQFLAFKKQQEAQKAKEESEEASEETADAVEDASKEADEAAEEVKETVEDKAEEKEQDATEE